MSSYQLNTLDLYKFLRSNAITRCKLGNVCAVDELDPIDFQKPALYVLNTAPSNSNGRHWVCIFIPEHSPPEFFDPLGKKPDYYHIKFENFLINRGPGYYHNMTPFQSIHSTACGYFCLYYGAMRCAEVSFRDVVNTFDFDDLQANDNTVIRFVENH